MAVNTYHADVALDVEPLRIIIQQLSVISYFQFSTIIQKCAVMGGSDESVQSNSRLIKW